MHMAIQAVHHCMLTPYVEYIIKDHSVRIEGTKDNLWHQANMRATTGFFVLMELAGWQI